MGDNVEIHALLRDVKVWVLVEDGEEISHRVVGPRLRDGISLGRMDVQVMHVSIRRWHGRDHRRSCRRSHRGN